MSNYRRWREKGGTYFFTLVTERRLPILSDAGAIGRLRHCRRVERIKRPFELLAAVVLPDHFHCLIRLPDGDDDFSTRQKQFKTCVTRRHLFAGGIEAEVSASKVIRQERGVLQRRFWEHLCRDEDDIKRHSIIFIGIRSSTDTSSRRGIGDSAAFDVGFGSANTNSIGALAETCKSKSLPNLIR